MLAGTFVLALAPTSVGAGFSGPGGPRLNYDSPPRIEPYRPPPDAPNATGRPGTHKDGGHAKPLAGAPHPSAPSKGSLAQPADPRNKDRSGAGNRKSQAQQATPSQSGKQRLTPRLQRRQILTQLYSHLSRAKTQAEGQRFAASIEQLWRHSDSPTVDVLMQRADRAIETGRWIAAATFADAVVKLEPGYTEGLMRRALINFQRRRPTGALRDLRRVLAIEPNHFVALDRVGAILENLGEDKDALEAYRKLKRVHPQAPGVQDRLDSLTRKVDGEPI